MIAALLTGCVGGSPAPLSPHVDLERASAETCANCHAEQHAEWSESMHARAHPSKDPIYAAMLTYRSAREGDDLHEKCDVCHAPGPEPTEGVTCVVCHDASGYGERIAASPDVCLRCHAEAKNDAGVPTCTTGVEAGDGATTCRACHMASSGGHRFSGPHRAWLQDDLAYLASALALQAELDGPTLRVRMTNAAGHALPTGFPSRQVAIHATGWGADGAELWTTEVAKLGKAYVDADGKPTMPPYAASIAGDTRLTRGESRAVEVAVPAGVQEVEVRWTYALLPAGAAAALGIADIPEAKPKVLGAVRARR